MEIDSKAFQSSLRGEFTKFLLEIVFFLYGNRLESLRISIVIEIASLRNFYSKLYFSFMTIDSKAFHSSFRGEFTKFLFEIVFFLHDNRLESLRLSIVIERRVYEISTRNFFCMAKEEYTRRSISL